MPRKKKEPFSAHEMLGADGELRVPIKAPPSQQTLTILNGAIAGVVVILIITLLVVFFPMDTFRERFNVRTYPTPTFEFANQFTYTVTEWAAPGQNCQQRRISGHIEGADRLKMEVKLITENRSFRQTAVTNDQGNFTHTLPGTFSEPLTLEIYDWDGFFMWQTYDQFTFTGELATACSLEFTLDKVN